MAPNDHCCRPTRRGLAVLDYLSAAAPTATLAQKSLSWAWQRNGAKHHYPARPRSAAHKHFALIMSEGSRFPHALSPGQGRAVIPVVRQNSFVQICKRIRCAWGLTKSPVSEAAGFPLRKLRAPAIVSLLVAHDSAGDVVRAPKENCWFAGERSIQSRHGRLLTALRLHKNQRHARFCVALFEPTKLILYLQKFCDYFLLEERYRWPSC